MSPRQKAEVPLVKKLADACSKVGVVPKRGRNEKYPYQRASDVAAALRQELFTRGVLILEDEKEPKFRDIPTNGGEQLQECCLCIEFEITAGGPETIKKTGWGIARDVEDKALYKAKTGALKYFLRGLGLIPDEADDPEWDEKSEPASETLDDIAPRRVPRKEQPLAAYQITAISEALATSGKTADELSQFVAGHFKADALANVKRKDFKALLGWASCGKGTLAIPKPQAVPDQGKLPLRTAPTVELKIGSKMVEFTPKDQAYSV